MSAPLPWSAFRHIVRDANQNAVAICREESTASRIAAMGNALAGVTTDAIIALPAEARYDTRIAAPIRRGHA